MDVPMQQLSNQLARIEREMSAIRRELARLEQPPARGGLPLAASEAGAGAIWADKDVLSERFKQLLVTRAVTGQPIGAPALQQQLAQEGLAPNELSQSLIAARGE